MARDSDVLFEKLEAQLLRAARPALRRLARASRGKGDFHNEQELRACLGLARVAATLLRRNRIEVDQETKILQKMLNGGAR